jgi:CheY-like chemotaxis protein
VNRDFGETCCALPAKLHFVHLFGTGPRFPRNSLGAGEGSKRLEDRLVILVIEDDQQISSIVEDALTDGGFEPAITASGEEAVTLLQGNKGKYRALVTDISLRGTMDGWEVARQGQKDQPSLSDPLHHCRTWRPMGFTGRSQQHSFDQTFCASAPCYSHFPTSQYGAADNLKRPRWRFHLAANKKRPQRGGEPRPLASVLCRGACYRNRCQNRLNPVLVRAKETAPGLFQCYLEGRRRGIIFLNCPYWSP